MFYMTIKRKFIACACLTSIYLKCVQTSHATLAGIQGHSFRACRLPPCENCGYAGERCTCIPCALCSNLQCTCDNNSEGEEEILCDYCGYFECKCPDVTTPSCDEVPDDQSASISEVVTQDKHPSTNQQSDNVLVTVTELHKEQTAGSNEVDKCLKETSVGDNAKITQSDSRTIETPQLSNQQKLAIPMSQVLPGAAESDMDSSNWTVVKSKRTGKNMDSDGESDNLISSQSSTSSIMGRRRRYNPKPNVSKARRSAPYLKPNNDE